MADPTDLDKPAAPDADSTPTGTSVAPPAPASASRIMLRRDPDFTPAPASAENLPLHGPQVLDHMIDPSAGSTGARFWPSALYLMMLSAVMTLGLSAVPAAFLAWRWGETAPRAIGDHYRYMLRSFLAGAGLMALAVLTLLFFDAGRIGVIAGVLWSTLLVGGLIWFVARNVVGLMRLWSNQPLANWRAWTI